MNPHFKNRGYFILLVFGVLTATIFILFSFYFYYNLKPVKSDLNFQFKIERGQGLKEIAATLSQNEVIRSIAIFKLYALFTGKAQHLKPGVYQLNGRLSVPEIINLFVKGPGQDATITILEGTTVKEIDRILSSAGVITSGSLANFDFKNSELTNSYPYLEEVDNLEGLLYPDTYRFKIASSVEEATEKFLNNFQEKIWPLISQKNNWYEVLILASILEKEVPTFRDQQLIAGVFNKRISSGMPIQADATIIYAKCQGNFRSCPERQITRNDLKIDSPYNSYQKLGWPPTPIANASQTTVKAALSPISSNYWYYLSAYQTKKTIFSKTLEEHNENRQQYLR
ncbi:MAG: endolytic transglycosylase MltG [Patescibacteria group bacterium]